MKNLFAVALSAFLLLSSGDAFSAAAPVKVVIAYAAMNARLVPLWAAEEKGFFNKYGVDAQLVFVRGAPTLNAAMVSGDIQMGYTGGTAVLGAAVGGADLKILAVFTNRVTYDLVAPKYQEP
jgi:ABC-type nitrate/sulfonate/bicarbonate transport system substrate-binding protein